MASGGDRKLSPCSCSAALCTPAGHAWPVIQKQSLCHHASPPPYSQDMRGQLEGVRLKAAAAVIAEGKDPATAPPSPEEEQLRAAIEVSLGVDANRKHKAMGDGCDVGCGRCN